MLTTRGAIRTKRQTALHGKQMMLASAFWVVVVLLVAACGHTQDHTTPTSADAAETESSAERTVGCSTLSSLSGGMLMCGILNSMGNPVADRAMDVEVSVQRAFWTGIPVQGVYPLNDCSPQRANALATAGPRNIYFGVYLFNRLVQQNGNILPVAGVLAHEWGHEVQYAFGWQTNPARPMELEADAMSGYFMALAKGWAWSYMYSYFQSVFESGDYNFNDPTHHGTPNERYAAARLGFDTAVQAARSGRPLNYFQLHAIFASSIGAIRGVTTTSTLSPEERNIVEAVLQGEAKAILSGARGTDAIVPGTQQQRRRLWPHR